MKIREIYLENFKSFYGKVHLKLANGMTCVVGPNGSGKCLTGEAQVLLADGSLVRIDELVNKHLSNASLMDDGFISLGDGTKVLTLGKDLKIHARPVQAFVKRTVPEELIKIHTRSGRSIISTPYHPLFTLKKGKVNSVRADELHQGTRIAVPRSLSIKELDKTFIELLDIIKEKDGVYVPWDNKIETLIREKNKDRTFKQLEIIAQVPQGTLHSFFEKQSINFTYLIRIFRKLNVSDKDIISKINFIKAKTSNIICRIPWQNSPELSRVLGYLLAGGRFPPDSNQIWFTNGTDEIVQDYYDCITNVFGIRATINEYKPNTWDVLAYSMPARIILEKLGMSVNGTFGKTVSNLFLEHSNKEELSALINGLYCVDGYVSPSSIELVTKSPSLAFAIETILLRLGMQPRKKEIIKIATNSGFSGRYYQINLYGVENFTAFSNNISLVHPKKAKRIGNLLGRKSNPNVDLFEVNDVVKDAVREQNIAVKPLKKVFPKLDAYVYSQCLPSRGGVQQLVQQLFVSSPKAKILSQICTSDIFWDEIIYIESVKPTDPWVYDLCVEKDHNFIANNIFVHNSNILDAICFLLGKSSAKGLRTENLATLIYNGNNTEKMIVRMIFEGEKGDEDKEIIVERSVRKNGNSRYRINQKTCTKREIEEVLAKYKIFPDGHNIILQGDITHLTQQRPIERVDMIEEIAGIKGYEEKKEEAQSKLERIDEKLKESRILITEKQSYLKNLRKEKEEAEKFIELKEELDSLKATKYKRLLDRYEVQTQRLTKREEELKEKLKDLESKKKKVQTDLDELRKKIHEIEIQIEEQGGTAQLTIQREIQDAKVNLEKKKHLVEISQNELKKIDERKKQIEQNIKVVEQKIQTIEEELKDIIEEIQVLNKQKEKYKKQGAEGDVESLERQIEKSQKQTERLEEERASLVSSTFSYQKDLELIEFQLKSLYEKKEELQKKSKELGDISDIKKQFQNLITKINALSSEDSHLAMQIGETKKKIFAIEEELMRKKVDAGSRDALISSNKVIDALLKEKIPGIIGPLASLGSAKKGYSTALEAVAGTKLFNVVTENEDVAIKALSILKEKKLGVITFLPLNKLKLPENIQAPKHPKVIDLAYNLVDCEPKLKKAFMHVLWDTIVLEGTDTAKALGVGNYRMVTTEGDLFDKGGAITGGYRQKQRLSLLSEAGTESELDKLASQLEELNDKVRVLEAQRENVEKQLYELKLKRQDLQVLVESAGQIKEGEQKLDINEQIEKLDKNQKEKKADLAHTQKQLQEKEKELEETKQKVIELNEQIKQIAYAQDLEEVKELDEQISQFEVRKAQLSAERNSVLLVEIKNLKNIQIGLKKEEEQFINQSKSLEKEIKELEKVVQKKQEDESKFFGKLKELFKKRDELNDQIDSKEKFLEEWQSKRDELFHQQNSAALERAEYDAKLSGVKEAYSQFEGKKILSLTFEEAQERERSIERRLSEKENINFKALEIYQEAEKQHKEIEEKLTKLESEHESITQTIQELEKRKEVEFLKTLEELNKRFHQIHKDLTGRDADLILVNKNKPVEEGVDIRVIDIKGKKVYLNALSGGEETLVALALMFAVQSFSPAPFYILDEIDVALDKTNSERIADMLRKYSEAAQVFIVSHNDAVISAAEYLFGISKKNNISKVTTLRI